MKNAQPTLTRAESIICIIASQFPGNGSYSFSEKLSHEDDPRSLKASVESSAEKILFYYISGI